MSTSVNTIELGDICIDVVNKDIKNVHLSVHPPRGRVTVSAPRNMELETIRLFCISKLGWIRKQQRKLTSQKREAAREYVTRESHYYLGKRFLLKVIEVEVTPHVILQHSSINLHVRKGTSMAQKDELVQSWYRQQLREIVASRVNKLEHNMGVHVAEVCVRRMKTKWGTCNTNANRIWLNSELAKKSIDCIDYVLIHEMVHLLERKHNDSFTAYMDMYLPNWKHLRDELNRSLLGHVEWSY